MLVRLFGHNFRSFKGEFELSTVAADLKREEDRGRGTIEVPIAGSTEPLRLLRALAIYGPNASGKSTLIVAAGALRWLVVHSSAQAEPHARISPYEPFLLENKSRTGSIRLGCDVVHNKSLLRYEIVFEENFISKETLVSIDENEEVPLIDRLPSGEVRGQLIAHSDANKLYVKEMQPNVAVLSKLAQHGPHKGKESARPYFDSIERSTRYQDYSNLSKVQFLGRRAEQFADDPEYREWIMHHLIRVADVGIRDVEARLETVEIPDHLKKAFSQSNDPFKLPEKELVVSFVHGGKFRGTIPFSDESAGTKKLFNLADDWWSLAKESFTLFADELGSGLHPRLLDRLVRAANDPPVPESIRSQLIFTTHDTGLLESQDGLPPALRRDQVYFTKKDNEGASELYSLTEFKEDARPVHNIRKRYLSGLYGAIPSVEKVSL